MNNKLHTLFLNLCCSHCKNGFNEDSIEIIRREKGLLVVHLNCKHCGKSFGTTFIGLSNLDTKSTPLEVQDGPKPINYDDVIDAHKFIKELDKHWQEHIPEKYRT